jgi:hypothetical protein
MCIYAIDSKTRLELRAVARGVRHRRQHPLSNRRWSQLWLLPAWASWSHYSRRTQKYAALCSLLTLESYDRCSGALRRSGFAS